MLRNALQITTNSYSQPIAPFTAKGWDINLYRGIPC